ncbi:MAG: UvrY/SirA/GacA family response regulator transcription factor [Candidatus Dadabacteria bacterium]|nr:UvrY/SirA/GacA family response regulator transcription factor [Candidatus Dadabacteria bacterium]
MINVVIIDDHDLIRAGIRYMLSDVPGIKVVGEANNGEDGLKLVRELSPEIVLMDIRMPGVGGLEATRKILQYSPDTKVLIITVCSDDMHPTRLLQIGAAGYLTKDASVDEMIQAIRTIHAGQRYVNPRVAQQLILKNVKDVEKTSFDNLSNRELQIAMMIVKGYKVKDIAEKLNLSPKTVNSYRYRIFSKLKIKGDVELVRLALQYGLIES